MPFRIGHTISDIVGPKGLRTYASMQEVGEGAVLDERESLRLMKEEMVRWGAWNPEFGRGFNRQKPTPLAKFARASVSHQAFYGGSGEGPVRSLG